MGLFPGMCSEIMGFVSEIEKKKTDMLFLVWTGRHANGDIQKVQSSLSSKAKCMRRRKQKRKKKERSGGLCGNLPIFITKMGLLKSKGGGEREEEMAL